MKQTDATNALRATIGRKYMEDVAQFPERLAEHDDAITDMRAMMEDYGLELDGTDNAVAAAGLLTAIDLYCGYIIMACTDMHVIGHFKEVSDWVGWLARDILQDIGMFDPEYDEDDDELSEEDFDEFE